MDKPPNKTPGIFFEGFHGEKYKPYPAWRYHEFFEPILVKSKAEDEEAKLKGWVNPENPIMGVQQLSNWRFDFEDMTAKQLVLFAREEYDVDLPVEAGQEKLIKAMWRLTQSSPNHKGRITLLAQTITMDYDETLSQIRQMAENFDKNEFTTKEVVM